MTSISWTKPAQLDLVVVDERYRPVDPDYADRFGREALEAGRFLQSHPEAGPEFADGLRKWRVGRTRHLLIYRVVADSVQVLRVRHEREDWRAGAP